MELMVAGAAGWIIGALSVLWALALFGGKS
jgi:hypothetical protein